MTFSFCSIKSAQSKKPNSTAFLFHFSSFHPEPAGNKHIIAWIPWGCKFFFFFFLQFFVFCFVYTRYNRTIVEVVCVPPIVWMYINFSCHNGNWFLVCSETAVEAAPVTLLKLYLSKRAPPFRADMWFWYFYQHICRLIQLTALLITKSLLA